MSDVRRRELERLAAQGDLDAAKALEGDLLRTGEPARDPLARDELLRESGDAGYYYAAMLLERVREAYADRRWHPRGIPFEFPSISHELTTLSVDPPDVLIERSEGPILPTTPGARGSNPTIALNLPDGYGNPEQYFHEPEEDGYLSPGRCPDATRSPSGVGLVCPGHFSVGILLSAVAGLGRRSDTWTGGVRIEVRGSSTWPERAFVTTNLSHALKPGWRDRLFLKWAEQFYNDALYTADQARLTLSVVERFSAWLEGVMDYLERRGVLEGSAYQEGEYRTRRARQEALRDADELAAARGLRSVPNSLGEGLLTPEEVAGWHAVLDELEASLGS